MKRRLPIIITFVTGVVMILQFFTPADNKISEAFFNALTEKWLVITGIFFLFISLSSLTRVHYHKIARQREGWGYSVITFLAIIITCVFGFVWGMGNNKPLSQVFNNVLVPLNATMFSILAFYMASAAFRAFRAKTFVSTILLITAIMVMLGRVSFGDYIWEKLPSGIEWIMTVPNMAQKRGIMLGVALAALATSLKIIIGIERSYLGSKD